MLVNFLPGFLSPSLLKADIACKNAQARCAGVFAGGTCRFRQDLPFAGSPSETGNGR